MADYDITGYGAVGDGKTNDAAAINQAIHACHTAGGGRVVVPAGKTFLSGSFQMLSHVELHVERGAFLLASPDDTAYTHTVIPPLNRRPWIAAENATDIAITGAGTIDANGRAFVKEDLGHIYVMNNRRPMTFTFVGCKRVQFRDVRIVDGASWTVRLSGCQDCVIHAISIYNDLKLPNSDAIDLDRCRDVRISDCHIESGDDCICLKAMQETDGLGPCENITVTGCTLVSTSAALIIGCEARAIMRNVVFDNCVITRSHRGLSIHLSEGSDVENVLFSNMVVQTRLFHHKWWGRAEPIYVAAIPWTKDHAIGVVRNVRFVNILAEGENGVVIMGWTPEQINGLLLENVRVHIRKTTQWPAGTIDLRPSPSDGGGAGPAKELPKRHTVGFLIGNASNVTVRNCSVRWGPELDPAFAHAMEADDAPGLKVEGFDGVAANPVLDAILRSGSTPRIVGSETRR